jgi:4-diphosphocytidyl-2-C-methyl-D-erythritol kinase
MIKLWSGKAYAKVNLDLSILGKLPNGFHQVKTIYTQIDVWDEIEIRNEKKDAVLITCNNPNIPTGKTNLAHTAVMLIKKITGRTDGVAIYLNKHIPVGAGLGGGSSDAATVLKGLNEWWNLKLSTTDLVSMATQLGSDVAYQLVGGMKMEIQGGEEKGILTDLGQLPPCWMVVAIPSLQLSSQKAYDMVQYDLVGRDHTEALATAIQKQDLKFICQAMQNDFEKWMPKLHPILAKLKSNMITSGALTALLSGKGAAMFGIYNDKHTALKAVNELKNDCRHVWLTKPHYNQE